MLFNINEEAIRKAAQEWFRKQKHKNAIEEKYINTFKALPLDERISIISRIKTKYESDEYCKRWYERAIEPPMDLFFLYYEYASKFGKDVSDTYNETNYPKHFGFANGIYETDEGFYVELLIGQGSAVKVYTKDELDAWVKYEFEN